MNLLERLVAQAPAKNRGPNIQTEHDLHTLPEMLELNGHFMSAVDEVIKALAIKHTEMEITGCWANIHTADFPHRQHSHFNNFLSAVYYVEAPLGGNRISFQDPRIQPYVIFPEVKEYNNYTSEHAHFDIVDGLFLIFPSWLTHFVPAGNGKARRTSIAFNVNFTEFSERISPPIWEGTVPTHPKM
jgi:uncharacterized protein (TIGR02466 family)